MDNAKPADRAALRAALIADGLDAYEWSSGGGIMHVAVDLGANGAMIATGDANTPCDVFLFGWDESRGAQFESCVVADGAVTCASIPEAVTAFRAFWEARGPWLVRIAAGELDV